MDTDSALGLFILLREKGFETYIKHHLDGTTSVGGEVKSKKNESQR